MSGIYDRARYDLLTAHQNWLTVSLRLTAWAGQPLFFPTDGLISAIKARGAVAIATSLVVGGTFATPAGYAQSDPVLLPLVPIGPPITWFTMSRIVDSTPNNDVPLLHLDDVVGLPFAPNGLDIVVTPDWVYYRGWFRP